MISVLPNGGNLFLKFDVKFIGLHSMISVLPNGGTRQGAMRAAGHVALDDISATEWRQYIACC